MHFAFISCSVVNMAYLQKPAHEAICIDTRLAAKFCGFFITFFHRNHSGCHWECGVNAEQHRCAAANARVCLCCGFGLWRTHYIQTSRGSEESTDTGTDPRMVDMHLTECLSFIHLFILGICACYTTGKVFCDDVFIFSVWVLPVAIKLVRVPDSSWLHCLH